MISTSFIAFTEAVEINRLNENVSGVGECSQQGNSQTGGLEQAVAGESRSSPW
jgi:hypothetical protein